MKEGPLRALRQDRFECTKKPGSGVSHFPVSLVLLIKRRW
jgi:hypothetical protein